MKGLMLAVFLVVQVQGAQKIELDCLNKVGQVLCSIHYSDQLLECLDGVIEGSVFRNEAIESFCFTEDPEYCVTQKLCDSGLTGLPKRTKPEVSLIKILNH